MYSQSDRCAVRFALPILNWTVASGKRILDRTLDRIFLRYEDRKGGVPYASHYTFLRWSKLTVLEGCGLDEIYAI